jgi:cytochrome c oxidase assembly protein subunit 15
MVLSLPSTLGSRFVRFIVWALLVANIGITVTGALVRLTASGLGCPTWPLCTEDSLVTTPEMGIHGIIEFGNRLLTFVILIVTVLVLVALWTLRREHRDLWRLGIILLAGIPLQAVVGGISVWMKLNPYVVGLHFVLSIAMTVIATILVIRVYDGSATARLHAVPAVSWLLMASTLMTLLMGILTTGSGPHAGDAAAPRNGLEPEFIQHVHSWPAYASIVLANIAWFTGNARARRWMAALLFSFVAQALVGVIQSRTGLPIPLVAVHVLMAMTTTAIATAAIYRSAMSGSMATAIKSAVR